MESQVRKSFAEAKSLAGTAADTDGMKYGVFYTAQGYLIVSEHNSTYRIAGKESNPNFVYVAYPGQSNEDIFRRALEQIAYPANWPDAKTLGEAKYSINWWQAQRNWMQSIAANALTNGGKG